ncbi:T9SS type A sorting domain-containing protein [Maribacter litoralis]|uniref:Por secretion system C-terminal sorting domain-containing protein n=1 Tax=Maribacter litoralis TaxID=2059726 RepID=A0A653SSM2_9FLAO|nr:T9SS type A sorting domain-containing protein [Maribacter litoralis]VXB70982.1 Por secretion system C-terminal sorting domain-containing protein [Maribacter litoralis]
MIKNYTRLLLAVFFLSSILGFSQTNYLQNSSFENWYVSPEAPENWSIANENNITKSIDATEGNFSLELDLNNTLVNQTELSTWNTSDIVLVPNTSHTFTFDYKVNTEAGNNLSAYLDVLKDEGSYTIQYIHEFIPLESDGNWHTYTFDFETESEEDYAFELTFRANTDPASSIKVDNFQVLGPETAVIPDKEALIALYYATDGPNWQRQWDLNAEITTWHGITTNSQGRVTELSLKSNNLNGTIPPEIQLLTELVKIELDRSLIYGQLPNKISGISTEFWNLTKLEEVNISNTELEGTLPPDIGQLISLKSLLLYNNNLTGNIPPEIGNLAKLEILGLGSNNFTGNIPSQLGQSNSLKSLVLSYNILEGNIPSSLSQISSLELLILDNNELTGTIPAELGQFTNLYRLSLDSNNLEGNIPNELSQLNNIETLDLAYNNLSGEIPESLGQLINLKYLELSGNNLTGEIPESLGQLTNLNNLQLGANDLTGAIPTSLGQLTNLLQLNLSNNNFSGKVPIFIQDDISSFSIQNNSLLFEDLTDVISNQSNIYYHPQTNLGVLYGSPTSLSEGEQFSLSVTETTHVNNTYQWRKDEVEIENETSSTFTIDSVTLEDAGKYDCVINNTIVTDLTLVKHFRRLLVTSVDDDKDGVLNEDDICPDTPYGEIVNRFGCSESQLSDNDDDQDGVPNANDVCENTPVGAVTGATGCSYQDILVPKQDDFTAKATSTSCPNTANGKLTVEFKVNQTHILIITGPNNFSANYTQQNGSTLTITDLEPGSYNIVANSEIGRLVGAPNVMFSLNIETPEEFISGKTVIDYTAKKASVVVSGSKNYQVLVNEKVYSFEVDNIKNQQLSFPLDKGSNIISIETDKICQGVFKDSIVLSNAILSPNPVEDILRVEGLDMMTDAQIIVSNLSGVTSLQDNYQINYGTLEMNISNLSPGVYMLTIVDGDKEINLKFVKK